MAHWLLKTEPGTYSFPDLLRDRTTAWEGISSPAALLHLRAMKRGDDALIYHSGAERAVVGLARVTSDPYPDPALDDPKRMVVDVAAGKPLLRPVPLATIKADPRFRNLGLVRISRLSVMPVTGAEWESLLALAEG
ncbi:MAG TPA: EVE domain-containing protein [Gemmatimonadales bacterium]